MEGKLDEEEEEEEEGCLLSVVTEEPGAGLSSDDPFPPPPPAMFDLGTEEEEGNFLQVRFLTCGESRQVLEGLELL